MEFIDFLKIGPAAVSVGINSVFGFVAWNKRTKIRRFLVGSWKGNMCIPNRTDRHYTFYASFYLEGQELVGKVFYEGKQNVSEGYMEIDGFDDLTTNSNGLEEKPREKVQFNLQFHCKGHSKKIGNVVQPNEIEEQLSDYQCEIVSWLIRSSIKVRARIGNEGQYVEGVWSKR